MSAPHPLDAANTPFSLSLLTSTQHNASKKLIANHAGQPFSDPTHQLGITSGTVERIQVAGLGGLCDLLQRVTTKQALVHGVRKGSAPGDLCALMTVAALTKRTQNGATRSPGMIARSLEDLAYPDGVRLIMLDVDPYPERVTPQSADELIQQLSQLWHAFTEVGWLATVSTRSAIKAKATDEWLTPPAGFHVYLLVTGDVARFRELARVKLWLAGMGYCKLASENRHTGVAAVLERCLIDLAVFSPERLDYVAGAIIAKDAPFYQARPAPELHPGAVLDLDALPEITDDERQHYAALVQAARAGVTPEREAKVRAHIQATTPDLDPAAITQEVANRLARTDDGILLPDHPLLFDGGRTRVTAGSVTAQLDTKRLADPFEPDYGPSHAVFHWNNGRWLINSFAHGLLKTYRLGQEYPHAPAPDEDEPWPEADEPAEEALLARAGSYDATRTGLVWWKPSGDHVVKVRLTNFTARIVRDVVEDDGAETRRYFELEAGHEERTHRFSVDAAHFAGMGWAMEHLGARAMVFPGITLKDHARAAVQLLSKDITRRHIYTHLGWLKLGERWCYLHASGAIGPDGPVPDVDVAARHALAAFALPELATREAQRAAVRASLRLLDTAADVVTIPLYAALWRAVLGQTDFSLHLVGPTGAGKSELAALAQQHYGAGMTARHLPAAWTPTGNALEGLAFEAKDVLLVVDDFCPSGSQADIARFHKDADRLLRAQGNHSGRQRMRFDGTLRPVKPPRGLIVSTGEDTPQGQSLRARILILDVTPDSVHWDKLTICQTDAANGTYATALAGFVQWLAPHYQDVSHGLQAEITTLRQAALTSGHRRTPAIVGNLALGMQYLLAYGHDIGALSLEECDALWQRSWAALGKTGDAQREHHANEEPVRRFLALLAGALAAGLAHIADVHTLAEPSTQPQRWGWRGQDSRDAHGDTPPRWYPQGTCVGWLANERLYLEPEAVFSAVQKLAESQKAPLPITQHTLWKRVHEQGLLVRESGQDKNKVRVTVGNTRRYVINIAASLLLETGPTGPTGPNSQQPQQNQGQFVDQFPSWYMKKPVHTENKTGPQECHAHDAEPWTGVAPEPWTGVAEPWTGVETEPVHKNNHNPQQNQDGGPVGPVGPVSTVEVPTSAVDAGIPQDCPRCGEVMTHGVVDGRLACVGCSTLSDVQVFHAAPEYDEGEV